VLSRASMVVGDLRPSADPDCGVSNPVRAGRPQETRVFADAASSKLRVTSGTPGGCGLPTSPAAQKVVRDTEETQGDLDVSIVSDGLGLDLATSGDCAFSETAVRSNPQVKFQLYL
jgi:hypothetical protein